MTIKVTKGVIEVPTATSLFTFLIRQWKQSIIVKEAPHSEL